GPAGCGASTLLRIIAGDIRIREGEVRIGSRDVTSFKRVRRPLLYTTSAIDAPSRWSVRHLLVAAARQRTIDREDRQHEIELASEVYGNPGSEAAAAATGDVSVVPVTIRGNVVESIIGSWTVDPPPFQGSGIALIRPDNFSVAAPGEESDLIFSIEEASFYGGAWHVRGVLSGAFLLRVTLPGSLAIHKGKLMALRYDASRFRLLKK